MDSVEKLILPQLYKKNVQLTISFDVQQLVGNESAQNSNYKKLLHLIVINPLMEGNDLFAK